jgi:hypothetical protein
MSSYSRRLLIILLALLLVCSTADVASRGALRSVAARGIRENENDLGLFQKRLLQNASEVEVPQEDDVEDEILQEKPWGVVLLTSLLINLVSLVGLVFVVAGVATKKWYKNRSADSQNTFNWKFTTNIIPSFACGALLATTCFLIVPEAIEMINHYVEEKMEAEEAHRWLSQEGEEEHADTDSPTAWRFGTSLIGGFLLPVLSSLVFSHHHELEICDNCQAGLDETGETSPGETRDILNKPALDSSLSIIAEGATHEKSSVDCHSCDGNGDHEHHDHAHQDDKVETGK